jgi:crotonobetainyl-CoA:carnitine CoA-transferase CaiB-like acyl-CoA transferase
MSQTSGPLAGLRVVDLSTMISGNWTTMTLADFGADVVKVEHPDNHDPVRDWGPFHEGHSMWWKSLGHNKRSVTLDLSTDEGQEVALALVADADVVVENFRPGTMERWGLGFDDLRAVNEGVIMVRISGFGQTGPKSQDPGFGSIAEGIAQFAHVNGFPDSEPLLPPIPLADITAGNFAVQGAMFAVFERDVGEGGSGEGQVVDVSLYEPLFRQMAGDPEAYHKTGSVRERTGNRSTNSAPRNLYEAADGYVTLSASSQRIFENVMHAIGREDLIDDPRFADNAARVEHADELDAVIEAWMADRSREAVIETMTEHSAIVGPVFDIEDIFASDLYEAREDLVTLDDPEVGDLVTHNAHPKLSRTPGEVVHAGPQHGEHTEEVYLDELGMSPERLATLRERGVVR